MANPNVAPARPLCRDTGLDAAWVEHLTVHQKKRARTGTDGQTGMHGHPPQHLLQKQGKPSSREPCNPPGSGTSRINLKFAGKPQQRFLSSIPRRVCTFTGKEQTTWEGSRAKPPHTSLEWTNPAVGLGFSFHKI